MYCADFDNPAPLSSFDVGEMFCFPNGDKYYKIVGIAYGDYYYTGVSHGQVFTIPRYKAYNLHVCAVWLKRS